MPTIRHTAAPLVAILVLAVTAPPVRATQRPPAPDTTAKDSLTKFVESFSWRLLGPAAYSGRITALAVPANGGGPRPKTFYAGAAGGGVWKTVNGGTTWQSVSTGLGVQTIGDLAVAPSDSGLLWVGTGEKNSLRSQWWGDGVYKSTDGARTWTKMGLSDTRAIGRIVIHPTGPDTVYVAALGHLWGTNSERGVFKTTDGGKTWTKILFVNDTTGFVDLEMDPADPSVLYAAAWHRVRWGGGHMQGVGPGSGIYKTTDGGRTWTRLTDPALKNGLPTDRMGRIGLAIARTDPKVIYAMIQVDRGITDPAQGRYGGVFRSEDGGATWTQVNDLQAIPHYYYDEIWVDPTNPDQVFIGATWLLRSRDGGKTFAQDSLHRVHVDHHALWIDPADPQHLILGNDGGVYLTRDGGKAWEQMAIPVGQFYTVMVDSSLTPYQVCGGLQDNGVWCGPSATKDEVGITDADWYSVNGGDGMWAQIPPDDPHTVYSGWQFGNISRLDLKTWKRDNITPQVLDAGRESGYRLIWGWTTPIVLSQHDPSVLYLGANHLVRLTKRGDDWEILGPDMTRVARQSPAPEEGHTSYHAIFTIAESPRRGGAAILWTGSDDGLVWVSQDTGRTWANVTGNLPRGTPSNCWVGTLVASAHADGVAYAVFDCHFRDDYRPHVYRTADFGRTWTEIGQALPREFGSLTIFESPRNPRVLWVGNAIGVYVTTDGGRSWRRLGRNLPRTAVERIAMSYAQRDLVVSTHGRGLWVLGAGPLEEVADTLLGQAAYLFDVPPALLGREADTYPSFGSRPFVAANPPKGAVITYYLREVQPEGVKLVVTTAGGDTIRTVTGPGYAGVQRVTWDLTRDRPRARELGGPTSREELRRVVAGEYTVHLTVGKLKLERKIVVRDWPADRLGRVR